MTRHAERRGEVSNSRLFVVRLICCSRDDGVYGPTDWEDADRFRESYCTGVGVNDGKGGHERIGIISEATIATARAGEGMR
jgi:hypothetical protein